MSRPAKAIGTEDNHIAPKIKAQRKENEEMLASGGTKTLRPPDYLSDNQKKIFKKVVQELKSADILTSLDVDIVATYSYSLDRMIALEKLTTEDIEMMLDSKCVTALTKLQSAYFKCCNELSLSPQARAKLANTLTQAQMDNSTEVLKSILSE